MRKIYSLIIILLTFIIIFSNYSYAAISRSNDSSISLDSVDTDSLSDSDSNSGSSDSNNDDSISISSDNNKIPITNLNGTLIDKFPKAYIVIISPNPASQYGVTSLIGWVKDPLETKVSFEWDFGDGEIYKGEGIGTPFWCNTTHKFNRTGEFIVILSILKDGKLLSNDSKIIKVISLPIFGDAGGPYYGLVGEKIIFGETKLVSRSSIQREQSNIISYKWDFGDGTAGLGQKVSHIYDSVGVYTAILTLTDDSGKTYSDSTTVTVGKIIIRIQPSNPSINEEVNFGVAVTGFTPTRYYWDFGDGSIGMGQSVTHIYNETKTYYGKLTFNKELGGLYSDFVITVNNNIIQENQKPISYFKVSPSSGDKSTLFEFDASSSVDKDGKIAMYEWYFGDGQMIITKYAKCNYIFKKGGDWTVKCVIIDDKGKYDSYQKIVKVVDNGQAFSDAVINEQKGLVFYDGKLEEVINENLNDDIPIIDKVKSCDLKVTVSTDSVISDTEKPIKINIKVSDSLGTYDSDTINIQLLSDVLDYKIVSYTAQRNQKSQDYELNIEIPLSEDAKSHTIVIVANPDEGYEQKDNSANRWSDTISIKSDDIAEEIVRPIDYTQTYGSLSM